MKQWLTLSLICLLISSCGLFKKTTKTSSSKKQIEKVEVQYQSNEEVKVDVGGKVSVKSIEQKQIQKDIDENMTLTADEIEVKSDGSTKGKGNAKLVNSRRDRSKSDQKKTVDSNDRYIRHIAVTKENKAQEKQEKNSLVKNTQSHSEPKGSMMVWLALGVLVLVVGLIWFLRQK
ncbi:hypothetical protein [Sphingobacterium multivorum]|uniref:hypothetical protein n=1 Tax=Sphingobacterium multivorum TaxID=28454 RepID=UPI0031BA9F12